MPQDTPVEALYVVGAQARLNGTSIFDSKHAREWTKSFEPVESTGGEGVEEELTEPSPESLEPPSETPTAETEEELAAETSPETEESVEELSSEPAKDEKKGRKKGGQPAARPSLIGRLATNGILS